MKPSKSATSLINGGVQTTSSDHRMSGYSSRRAQPAEPQHQQQQSATNPSQGVSSAPTSPICRCRVIYLGSSVPHITKDGLQGIQEPLRELYPDSASLSSSNAGIDSWLSVWSNGILIENVDESGREVKRFFKIEALHYCAAVKFVPLSSDDQQVPSNSATNNMPKFLPLDSPHARLPQANANPPIFASILRRSTGVKVLECHAFICKREAAANALVRCCFHAYADTMYAKQIGADVESVSASANNQEQLRPLGQAQTLRRVSKNAGDTAGYMMQARRSRSIAALNEDLNGDQSDSSGYNTNQNNLYQANYPNSIMRRKSMQESNQTNGDDASVGSHQKLALPSEANNNNNNNNILRKQYKLSKSMHQLNQAGQQMNHAKDYASQFGSHSTSIHNLASSKARWNQAYDEPQLENGQPAFYNPYASRVPSYPPQSLIDQHTIEHQKQLNSGGTLRSIKSVAANSIASTLLRSKKHAKAMSAAQMNQHQDLTSRVAAPPVMGFHQVHSAASATLAPSQSFMMPPVPPMFLPRLPIVNGSQTMKLPKQQMPPPHGQINFETMTPKELKKLLKRSAKYGLDPTKFSNDHGLPPLLPFRPMAPCQIGLLPPPPPQLSMQSNKSGTMNSQSVYSVDQHSHISQDIPDLAPGLPPPQGDSTFGAPDPMDPGYGPCPPPIKSILVKPNPEFLKSKAGKKWLKQQKEFKKLLPPHLDGLPIVFGPPPLDALEPALVTGGDPSATSGMPPAPPFSPPQFFQLPNASHLASNHPGLPMLDSNGYYSQQTQPMYLLPSGRASTASTLLRHSPHNFQQDYGHRLGNPDQYDPYAFSHQRGQYNFYGQPQFSMPGPQQNMMMPAFSQRLGDADSQAPVYGHSKDSRPHLMANNNPSMQHRRRRHMVEQSVISLGDENEGEDEDDRDEGRTRRLERNMNGRQAEDDYDDDDDNQSKGYYNQLSETSSSSQRRFNDHGDNQNYEQVMPPQPQANVSNDDQSSYSSGIYKRGHLNERAFSYSIRQEHKSESVSNPNSEQFAAPTNNYNQVDYEQIQRNHNHVAPAMYENPQHQRVIYDKRNGHLQYTENNNITNHVVVDELSSHFENQLNMRSFVNAPSSSKVRSHM